MKLRCNRAALLEKLALVGGVCANRSTRAILQHVVLELDGDGLVLLATDLELAIRHRHVPLDWEGTGSIALPAKKLLDILRECQGDSIEISTDQEIATIRTSTGQFRVSGLPVDDFPEIPRGDDVPFVQVPAELFRELTERTEFAASKELGRYAINGILIDMNGRGMCFVSTDGRRMAYAEATLESEVETVQQILPLNAVNQFLKSFDAETEVVGVSMIGRRVLLSAGNSLYAATTVEADFPDYRQAIPQVDNANVVLLDREPFFAAVRQAAIMSGDDSPAIVLTFSEGSLVVSSRVEGLGDARVEMGVDYVGEEVELSFNPAYLQDFAKVSLPDQLPFQFRDRSSSCVFRPADEFAYVVMPISV